MRTQVGIVGAGPAGLMLAHPLARAGVESVVLESRSRQYVEQRVRAGVLEQETVDLLVETGAGGRLQKEGLVHHAIELRFEGRRHRIPLTELTGGRSITVYGQQEVVKDLIRQRVDAGGQILFEAEATRVDPERATIDYGEQLECDFVAGCDGRLFLAGDAAHIVPPTGAKGMNLAIADVRVLADALIASYREGRSDPLDRYSETCLRRVWGAEHFPWWMTSMLHRFPDEDAGFPHKLQLSQLRYATTTAAAAASLAENYVGLETV